MGLWYPVVFGLTGLALYWLYKNMPRAGSPLFRLGYCLYTKTRFGYVYYQKEVKKAREKYGDQGHSDIQPTNYNGLQILPIAMSTDNLAYLVTDTASSVSVLIDPAEVVAVQSVLDKEKKTPTAVLATHKHWDHSAGNKEWKRRYRGIRIYGGINDNVPDATNSVQDRETLEFGHMRFTTYDTPGHTSGHVVYVLDGEPFGAPPCLFSGDHLFLAGIGRMFECPPQRMLESLDTMCRLPLTTLIWPGHEYAQDNLEFACSLCPENMAAKSKLEWVREQRKQRLITSPSTLEEELTYNPFLRVEDQALLEALGMQEVREKEGLTQDQARVRALFECRTRKDKFKYKL